MSPVNARAGNSHQMLGSMFQVWISAAVSSGVMFPALREVTLKYWKVRNTAAPATALKICASMRVRLGPMRRNSAVTISRARPVAMKANVTMNTMADSHNGDENSAIHSSGGPSSPA